MEIPIKIMLHGLIALVPTVGPNGSDHMTALLIDARNPPAVECAARHVPELVVTAAQNAQCRAAQCRLSGNRCTCTDSLVGKEISIEITPAPVLEGRQLGQSSITSLPVDAAAAGNFRYVANLVGKPFEAALDPQYLANPLPETAREHLLARMSVPFAEVTACALARREDGGVNNVHAFAFRKLGEEGRADEDTQALAQMVVATLTVPDAPPSQQRVTLRLRDFDGGAEHAILLDPGEHGYHIELTNETPELERHVPCDDGIARHFASFFDLALNPPLSHLRPIPHVRLTQFKSDKGLAPRVCDPEEFNAHDRPICPMATFMGM